MYWTLIVDNNHQIEEELFPFYLLIVIFLVTSFVLASFSILLKWHCHFGVQIFKCFKIIVWLWHRTSIGKILHIYKSWCNIFHISVEEKRKEWLSNDLCICVNTIWVYIERITQLMFQWIRKLRIIMVFNTSTQ